MQPEAKNYLDEVRLHLRLDPAIERRIIRELYTDFQDRVTEVQTSGLSERDATKAAIGALGRARVIAQRMYEAHSKGSWTEAALASLPHLIIALLFVFHLWRNPFLATAALTLIVGVTLYGWWHGKPSWLYPWIGYSLLPLLIGGYAFRSTIVEAATYLFRGEGSLPSAWIMTLVLALVLFSLWIIIRTTVKVVKRDWLLASLMLVPLPVVGGWLLNLEGAGGLFQRDMAGLHQLDGPMALALICLAATSAVFIRLRQRVLRFVALLAIGTVAVATVGHYFGGSSSFFGLLLTSLLLSAFLLSPALLEAKVGHGEQREEAWWQNDWVKEPSAKR
jgi:hypothetical protein